METITQITTVETAVKQFSSLAEVNSAYKEGLISSDLFLKLWDYYKQR